MRKALTIIGLAVLLLSIILYINKVKDYKIEELRDTPAVAEAIIEPVPEPIATPVVPEPIPEPTPVVEPPAQPQATCESEIAKYDWNYQVAYNVMMAESGGRYWVVNNNPATKDYSVGCFQINLYGNNARTRPSEAELKDPAVNVAFAYRLYSGNGKSFIGQWGVCRKIYCY